MEEESSKDSKVQFWSTKVREKKKKTKERGQREGG